MSANPFRSDDESLVDLRCSAVVLRATSVLLVRRTSGDWVLPGGRPRDAETLRSCVRREMLAETGVTVTPTRCAFVGEAIAPDGTRRTVDLVFLAEATPEEMSRPLVGESGSIPQWVALADLPSLRMMPPIGGYLPALRRSPEQSAAYLGNLWRSWPLETGS